MKMYNLIIFSLFYTPGLLAEAADSSRTDNEYPSDWVISGCNLHWVYQR